jgi:hypothetical protein
MKVIKGALIFKIKSDQDGKIAKFKARCVAKGYLQQYGIDYFETFSPTLRQSSLRYLLSFSAINNFNVYHLDVQTAFLNGHLAEDIYMEVPEGFESLNADKSKQVLKLKKSIYGLKQSSRVWNETFTNIIKSMGFQQSQADPCLFLKYNDNQLIAVIGIFVDDCLVSGEEKEIEAAKNQLKEKLSMHDLGLLSYALGIKVVQNTCKEIYDSNQDNKNQKVNNNIKISQTSYIEKLLEKFNMKDCKPSTTPLPEKSQNDNNNTPFKDINLYQQLVGSLMYVQVATRPDLAYPVGCLARSMKAPTEADWMNAKRVLRYLQGTKNLSLSYHNSNIAEGFSDSSYAEERDRKSVGGYIFKQAGAAITWRSAKQDIVAQSSMEAEYIALAEAAKEAMWIRKLQQEFFPNIKLPTIIKQDNQSTIKLANNPIHTNRSKHIDVRYHATRNYVQDKFIRLEYVATSEMIADITTKSLGSTLQKKFVKLIGLTD